MSDVGVWLYDVETGEEQSLFRGACRYLAFSPDGRFLANGGERSDVGKVQLWEVATGREVVFPEVYDTASAVTVFLRWENACQCREWRMGTYQFGY